MLPPSYSFELAPTGSPPVDLTPMEQAVAAELAYYHQTDQLTITVQDEAAWQRHQARYLVLQTLGDELTHPCSYFPRFVLERHGYDLHHYLARQLSPEAWACCFKQGGILAPFWLR